MNSRSTCSCLAPSAVLNELLNVFLVRSRFRPVSRRQQFDLRPVLLLAMAPKASGGAGNKSAQDYVTGLWLRGATEAEVRQQLKDDGYKAGRISQLIKATRPADGQAGGAVAAVSKVMARPAAADHVAAAKKKPAASSSAAAPEAGKHVVAKGHVRGMFDSCILL